MLFNRHMVHRGLIAGGVFAVCFALAVGLAPLVERAGKNAADSLIADLVGGWGDISRAGTTGALLQRNLHQLDQSLKNLGNAPASFSERFDALDHKARRLAEDNGARG